MILEHLQSTLAGLSLTNTYAESLIRGTLLKMPFTDVKQILTIVEHSKPDYKPFFPPLLIFHT